MEDPFTRWQNEYSFRRSTGTTDQSNLCYRPLVSSKYIMQTDLLGTSQEGGPFSEVWLFFKVLGLSHVWYDIACAWASERDLSYGQCSLDQREGYSWFCFVLSGNCLLATTQEDQWSYVRTRMLTDACEILYILMLQCASLACDGWVIW